MEDHAKKRVGVLALQGAFQEHSAVLQRLGAQTHEVRTTADLDGLDGIVLPGAYGCWDRTHSIGGLNTRVRVFLHVLTKRAKFETTGDRAAS